MRIGRVFSRTPESVPLARHFVVDVLRGIPAEVLDAIVLMVSELTTNSVLHAATDFEVSIEHRGDQVRVEVSDQGPGMPETQLLQTTEAGGRGLHIVETMSDDWGFYLDPGRVGKTVWFVICPNPEDSQIHSTA